MAQRSQGKLSKLKEEHKVFLTQRLAIFDTPQEAAKALSDEFGITITPQSAEHYDPTKRAGWTLAKHLCELFESTRKRFLEKFDAIPHANKAVRIRKLAKAADTFESKGNLMGMAEMLVLIAKERGGCFTNQREISGRDGRPIQHEDVTDYDQMSDDQLRRRLATLAERFIPLYAAAHAEEPEPAVQPADAGTTRH